MPGDGLLQILQEQQVRALPRIHWGGNVAREGLADDLAAELVATHRLLAAQLRVYNTIDVARYWEA